MKGTQEKHILHLDSLGLIITIVTTSACYVRPSRNADRGLPALFSRFLARSALIHIWTSAEWTNGAAFVGKT
jgi:hypothetical protein